MTVQEFYDYCKEHNCCDYSMLVTDQVRFCRRVEFEGYWEQNAELDDEYKVVRITI